MKYASPRKDILMVPRIVGLQVPFKLVLNCMVLLAGERLLPGMRIAVHHKHSQHLSKVDNLTHEEYMQQ